jgi:hypothetical protein
MPLMAIFIVKVLSDWVSWALLRSDKANKKSSELQSSLDSKWF